MIDCLIGLVDVSATAEHEVSGLIPGWGEVSLGFFVRKFPVVAQSFRDDDVKIVRKLTLERCLRR